MQPVHIVLSCEHGGNKVPVEYGKYFQKAFDLLNTHRGLDIGSLKIAETLSERLSAPLVSTIVSRLVVDCNRSIGNMSLFSVFTESIDKTVQQEILNKYYYPYRAQVKKKIEAFISEAFILHLSIHTFTPVLNGAERKMDLAFLYDENRYLESDFCKTWLDEMDPKFVGKLALNQPYNGADDGLTTALRKEYPEQKYMGIELEINQKWAGTKFLDQMIDHLIASLLVTLEKKELDGCALVNRIG